MEKWKKEKENEYKQEFKQEDEEDEKIDFSFIKDITKTVIPEIKAKEKKKKIVFGKLVKDANSIGFKINTVAKKVLKFDQVEEEQETEPVVKPLMEPEIMKMDPSDQDSEGDEFEQFMSTINKEHETTEEKDKIKLLAQPIKTDKIINLLEQQEPDLEVEEIYRPIIETDQEVIIKDILETKKKEFKPVDHTKIDYPEFRKNFYIPPKELLELTEKEIDQKRIDLDGIQIRGVGCPCPVEKWSQFGMPPGVHEIIKKFLKYERPTSIQAQAIPAIMSGRDVIGIAKTGSGKVILINQTIAFMLPMLRHIKDQRLSMGQEGPVALIMTPTRELAMQIFKESKPFTKSLGLRAVCCYGGSPIREQIAQVKRGCEIIICTPGRMIDLLCANGGRVTNLRRVTYLVMDEADRYIIINNRMFDMGFEPQVMKIIESIRPDRQTVLFSATFPRFMEALARKILIKPLEVLVGLRSVVCEDVTQVVEVHQNDDSKFLRLLAILGKASSEDPNMKMLIFVDRQEGADTMMANLMKRSYPCLALHGGKDQADRDSIIQDFKNHTANILVATSVAARGLDVKELKYVVNYDCPNHLEDYVHRCGRTGRAGNKGTAYTFIMPSHASRAKDLVKALSMSNVAVPRDLKQLADKFMNRVRLGVARIAGSGFGGRGLERFIADRDATKKIQMREHGGNLNEDVVKEDGTKIDKSGLEIQNSSETRAVIKEGPKQVDSSQSAIEKTIQAAKERAARLNQMLPHERAQQIVVDIGKQRAAMGRSSTDAACWAEVEINDYPQQARFKVTSKEQIHRISEVSGTAITARGVYVPQGRQAPPGERKLYLVL
jgi:ATP-dependent RNA helicase DDX46/PRP5